MHFQTVCFVLDGLTPLCVCVCVHHRHYCGNINDSLQSPCTYHHFKNGLCASRVHSRSPRQFSHISIHVYHIQIRCLTCLYLSVAIRTTTTTTTTTTDFHLVKSIFNHCEHPTYCRIYIINCSIINHLVYNLHTCYARFGHM